VGRKRGIRRAARALRLLTVLGLLLVLALVALDLRIAHQLTRVDGVFDHLGDRPAGEDGTTVLLIGTVSRATGAATVPWLPGRPALESVMLVDLSVDGTRATVDSLALDRALVAEVTAAQPHRAVGGVESVSGRRVDHLVVVDWAALQQLADDNGTGLTYRAGSSVRRQQEFLEAVLQDALHWEMAREPWNLYGALRTVSRGMAVEQDWSVLDMNLLVLSLRDLRSADIHFRTG
jgi:hypothetical protein